MFLKQNMESYDLRLAFLSSAEHQRFCPIVSPAAGTVRMSKLIFRVLYFQDKKNSSDEINPKYYLKLLMIGTTASGKSTFAKQMKILHMNGFSDSEKEDFKRILAWNLMLAVNELLEQAKKLGRLENSGNTTNFSNQSKRTEYSAF